MIVVFDPEGMQVFATEDDTLLPRVQDEFASPPYTINTGPTVALGPLSGTSSDYHRRMVRRILAHHAQQLRADINAASNMADIKQAMLDLLQLMGKAFKHLD